MLNFVKWKRNIIFSESKWGSFYLFMSHSRNEWRRQWIPILLPLSLLNPYKILSGIFFIIISTTDRIARLTTCFFTAHIKRSRISIIQRMKQMVFNFCILDCLIKFLRYFSFSQTLVVDFPFVSEFIFFLFARKM